MRRYMILAAAVAMQMCLGAVYAWAVFVADLKKATGLGQGAVQWPVTLFYMVFPLTTIVAGRLIERFGPRACAVSGGLVFGAGWLLASQGARHFSLLILGAGLMGGVGVGLAYLVPITTCVLWFPRHKGLVTGIAVTGFGGGAAAIATLSEHLMTRWERTPFETFGILGAIFIVLIPLAGWFMRRPAVEPEHPHHSSAPLRTILREPVFRILYLAMFASLAAGLSANVNLRQLGTGGAVTDGVSAVVWFAVANAAGRLIWGWVFDRVRSRTALSLNLLLQAALLAASPWLVARPGGIRLFAALAGLNYGGVLVLYASTTARRWGVGRVGSVYGCLFSSNFFSAHSTTLSGLAYDRWGSFTVPFLLIAGLMAAAAIVILRNRSLHAEGRPAPLQVVESYEDLPV